MLKGKKYWNKIAKGYSKTGGSKWIRHPWTIRLAGAVKNKKVLELGCGTGVIINNLAHKGAIGTGVDYSKEMLLEAQSKANELEISTRFIHGDIRDLRSLYDEKFDLIIISAVLITVSSITTITKILSEAKKLLTTEGIILIAEPHPFFDHYMRSFFKGTKDIKKMDYQAKGKKYTFDMVDGNNIKVESIIYHWRLEDYSVAIHHSGLYIYQIFEPKPIDAAKKDMAWYAKRSRYPAYIFILAKPTTK